MIAVLKSLWANVYLRFFLVCALAYALYVVLSVGRPVWSSVLIAFLLAYLLDPLVRLVGQRSNRALGLLLVFVLTLFGAALLWLLGARMAAQLSDFVARMPSLVDQLVELPYLVARFIDPRFGNLFNQAYTTMSRGAELFVNEVLLRLEGIGTEGVGVTERVAALGGGGAQVAITLIMTIYLLYNFPVYIEAVLQAVPSRHRSFVAKLVSEAGRAVADYVRAQLLISLIVGLLTFLGLSLVGVPLAAALGLLATFANLIPFLGPVLIALPAVLLAATEGGATVLWTLAVLVGLNQLDGHVISPVVFARVNELDPLLVIIAILAGAVFFGLPGAVIAVPVAAFLRVLYTDYYLRSRWYTKT